MAFFDRQGIWRSLLDLKGKNNTRQQTQVSEKRLLSEAAAASRVLGQEDSVRPTLHGVLAVKIRMASLIKFDKSALPMGGSYCTITVRNSVKRTQVAQSVSGILKWDQSKHFPIQVVRNRRHPFNLVRIELFSYSSLSTSDIVSVGSISFHIHDILRANPIAGTYDLWNDNIQVGDIDLEFTHSYGSFGYGYSPQLKEEDMCPEEIITYSLFPRVIPTRTKREPDHPVMVVCATPHPRFIPFKERVYLSYGKEIKEVLEEAPDQMYQPALFEKEMSDFDLIRDEYYSTTNRFARLTFLRNYLKGSTNQEEVTVGLHDETNQEGDTHHRVLISKGYTKFVASDNEPFKDDLGRFGSTGGMTGGGGLTVPGTNPITISPPSGPLPEIRGMLQAAASAKNSKRSNSWASGLQGEPGSVHSVYLGPTSPPPEIESDFKGNQLNIPGAWPAGKK